MTWHDRAVLGAGGLRVPLPGAASHRSQPDDRAAALVRKEDMRPPGSDSRRPGMRTRIKEYRARYDMTQDDLAKVVGVRRETIVFLEKGKYNPSLKLAHDVAKALRATIDELFIFDEESDVVTEE